jgi:transposase-like protein
MATPRMDITSFVGKLLEQDDVDALREGVRVLAQAVMETEVSTQIGAGPYERGGGRSRSPRRSSSGSVRRTSSRVRAEPSSSAD